MKQTMLTFFVLLSFMATWGQEPDSTLVYKLDIKEMIAPPVWRKTMKAVDEAEQLGADYILIHMNTYGGMVDAADSISTKLMNTSIPTLVFIDNNAASAGALISIACDSIYMRPGGKIGAATVVNQEGQAVPDKYQSYMRGTMRAAAESHGKLAQLVAGDTVWHWRRRPAIAEAMVDPELVVDGVSEKGKVLTFTATEAMANGYCEGKANTVDELLQQAGIKNYRLVEPTHSAVDGIINFLINPVVHGILIMLMLGGIYFELQSPGIGFPIAAAVVGAVLYFAPLYLEGIAANWEIAVFVLGVILMAVEVFAIPGFGVAGAAGIACMVLGLSLSMVDSMDLYEMGEFNAIPLFRAAFVVMLGMGIPFVLLLLSAPRLFGKGFLKTLVLEAEQKKEAGFVSVNTQNSKWIGQDGIALTDLRPVGKVELNGDVFDAKSMDEFVEKGTPVRVLKFAHGQLYVRPLR